MNSDYKTGNKKCWFVTVGPGHVGTGRYTLNQVKVIVRNGANGEDYCRDGYKLVPCDGPAHSNAHIDNCMVCAPRWGKVMVKA